MSAENAHRKVLADLTKHVVALRDVNTQLLTHVGDELRRDIDRLDRDMARTQRQLSALLIVVALAVLASIAVLVATMFMDEGEPVSRPAPVESIEGRTVLIERDR